MQNPTPGHYRILKKSFSSLLRKQLKPRLLVVTRHSPLPWNDGAGAYLFDLLSYLSRKGTDIEVVWLSAEGEFVRKGWWRVPKKLSSVARITVIGSLAIGPYRFFWWGNLKGRVLGFVKSIIVIMGLSGILEKTSSRQRVSRLSTIALSHGQPQWSSLPTVLESKFFGERLRSFKPKAILANYCWLAPLLPQNPLYKKLILAHDVASHRLNLGQTAVKLGHDLDPATHDGEAKLLSMADVVIAISSDDAAVFQSMVPPKKGVIVVTKSAPLRPLNGTGITGRCLFIGGLNQPNLEGLTWFLDRVWPRVRKSNPKVSLHVCGAICDLIKLRPEGVIFRGRVENLDEEYKSAEVVIVPLLQGTGVKIKLVEACSHGKACVTTPVGLQGLAFLKKSVIEAADEESFASGVSCLLENTSVRQQLETETMRLVALNLSPQKCYDPVWEAIAE